MKTCRYISFSEMDILWEFSLVAMVGFDPAKCGSEYLFYANVGGKIALSIKISNML